jgi:hypothetical protein
MKNLSLLFTCLFIFISLFISITSCGYSGKEYSFDTGNIQYSFKVPLRYQLKNTIDIITFSETIPYETHGLSDEQENFYKNCQDFPEILISTYTKPEIFHSREEVEEYNRQQSEKYGFELNLVYDYKMLADFITTQDEQYTQNYEILSREVIGILGKEGIKTVSIYTFIDENNKLESEIISYEAFFEYESTIWNIDLVAPTFLQDITEQDFNHIVNTFKILD